MLGHGGSSAGSYLADPTSPIPSHSAQTDCTTPTGGAAHLNCYNLYSLLQSYLFRFIRREVNLVTDKQHCTYYLHLLRELLWPGGELDRTPTHVPSPQEMKAVKDQARRCLLEFFPG